MNTRVCISGMSSDKTMGVNFELKTQVHVVTY